ncbi:hypothetical protein BDZ89DRAFT_1078982 [Hymenopellis radicata]|nr:hypothetical protein BDZ89DRAFT_1078982 [Hymenopellis radicata]
MPDSSHPSVHSCPGCAFLSRQPAERESRANPLRITALLRCNDPPLDTELSEFQLFRAQSPAILTDLDAKITQAHDMLQRFIRAREHAESHLHDTNVTEYDSMHPSHPPWTLSQVCGRWRRLSLSLPELWSRFNLDLWLHKNRITPQRSGNYPLSLYLASSSTNRLSLHPVLPVLQASSSRWQNLRFSMYMADLTSFEGHVFPLLEAIIVGHLHGAGRVDTFQSAPNLRFFSSNPDTQALKFMTVPYANITCGVFTDSLSPQSVTHLRKMTRLERLFLELESPQRSEVERTNIVLPRLVLLHVSERSGVGPGRLASFLEQVKTPTLSSLGLSFTSTAMLFPEFNPAIESLTTLTVYGDMGCHRNNTRHLLRFLSRVPTVTSLEVVDKSITSEFVVGLTVASNRQSLLPLLRSLDISGCDYHSKMMPLKYFWAMFESRLPRAQGTPTSGAVLKEISVPQWLYDRDDDRWRAIRRVFESKI